MNTSLNRAKYNSSDEYYTLYDDIAEECRHYVKYFDGKIIYCPCDDPHSSNFYKYFKDNFSKFGLRLLIASSYSPEGGIKAYYDGEHERVSTCEDNGDFDGTGAKKLFAQADIVVTNPPFSLYRRFIDVLSENRYFDEKKFLIIGSFSANTVGAIYHYWHEGKYWYGVRRKEMKFRVPSGDHRPTGASFYTNMEHGIAAPMQQLTALYSPDAYPKYENLDAIHVDRIRNIPIDYYEDMAVPITFPMKRYNIDFEVKGLLDGTTSFKYVINGTPWQRPTGGVGLCPVLYGKEKFKRLLIKRV